MRVKAAPLIATALLATAPAKPENFWSIYWVTPDIPCSDIGPAIVSSRYQQCSVGGVGLSICPGVNSSPHSDPYNSGKPIRITAYQITQAVTDPQASSYVLIGSANQTNPGGDIFASCAGNGTHHCGKNLSVPLQQGGPAPGSHIDVYASCRSPQDAKQRLMVILEYTTPD